MTSAEIIATYTKGDIWSEFKKVQAAAGFDINKLKEANSLYQLYMAYDQLRLLSHYKRIEGR